MQLMHRRRERRLPRKHPRLLRRQVALAQITRRTGCDHVLPGGLAALAARNDVIEGEVVVGRAVLADEAVAQEHVEPGEGGMRGWLDEGLQRHHARQLDLERGAAHRAVVVLNDIDAVEEHRLDRVLPRPKRQRIITERPEVRVQHQYRPTTLRDVCVQVTLLTPVLAAKQHELTYYRQRDGIVKSVRGLIQRGWNRRHRRKQRLCLRKPRRATCADCLRLWSRPWLASQAPAWPPRRAIRRTRLP